MFFNIVAYVQVPKQVPKPKGPMFLDSVPKKGVGKQSTVPLMKFPSLLPPKQPATAPPANLLHADYHDPSPVVKTQPATPPELLHAEHHAPPSADNTAEVQENATPRLQDQGVQRIPDELLPCYMELLAKRRRHW